LAAVGFAVVLSAGVVLAVHEGRVSGGKSKVVHLLAQDPVGFWSALSINLFMAGICWCGAYWIYINRIKKQDGP
jgi:hypothetical protein